jgi:beta-aspartyl-dipeptidase (metallo-type)
MSTGPEGERSGMRVTLVRGGEVYAPDYLGTHDVLVVGERIFRVGADLRAVAAALGSFETLDAAGLRVIPGLIDQHVHTLGGGDGNGPLARVPELQVTDLTSCGVTTAVGILGVDMETRGLPLLMRKAHELEGAGVTSFFYTGAMRLPPPHLLGSICADVAFLEKAVGAKTALAERFYPNNDRPALLALASELMRARALSGKAAVLHCHIGGLPEGLAAIFDLVETLGMPVDQVVPTHVNRTAAFSPVFEHAIRFAKMGGTIDLSCILSRLEGFPTGIDVPDAVQKLLAEGVSLANVTISTDGNVPVAIRDEQGHAIGLRIAPPSILHRDVMRLVREADLPLETALPLATSNVARVLGIGHRKGRIASGLDADIVLLDAEDRIHSVLARGRSMVRAYDVTVADPYPRQSPRNTLSQRD